VVFCILPEEFRFLGFWVFGSADCQDMSAFRLSGFSAFRLFAFSAF
jgi:hypothetical protein